MPIIKQSKSSFPDHDRRLMGPVWTRGSSATCLCCVFTAAQVFDWKPVQRSKGQKKGHRALKAHIDTVSVYSDLHVCTWATFTADSSISGSHQYVRRCWTHTFVSLKQKTFNHMAALVFESELEIRERVCACVNSSQEKTPQSLETRTGTNVSCYSCGCSSQ